MSRYGRQCERQVGIRPTLLYNAVMIPRIVLCPHNALPSSPYCERHQHGPDPRARLPIGARR
jgi:hypothetical protein